MQKISTYSELAPSNRHYSMNETDTMKQVSIFKAMAEDKTGTEIITRTYAANEDVVIPSDEELVNVDHDRLMAVTRVTTSRPYDAERSRRERADAEAAATASPTYPQPTGGLPERASDPSTSYEWGTIDVTKVQNVDAVKAAGPTIAEREAAGQAQETKDQTEVVSELHRAALDESAEPAHDPEQPVDSASKDEAAASAQSPAQAEVFKDASDSESSDSASSNTDAKSDSSDTSTASE